MADIVHHPAYSPVKAGGKKRPWYDKDQALATICIGIPFIAAGVATPFILLAAELKKLREPKVERKPSANRRRPY